MPASLTKNAPFKLTTLDRVALDPDQGALQDIQFWAKLYFDATVFDWQAYFYHHPAKDKMVVAGIRTGKSKGAAFGLLHYMWSHPGCRVLNTSISAEQAKIVYHELAELAHQDRFKHWIERDEKSPYPLIRLYNGAEFWARSVGYQAEYLRGFEFDVINIDEAGYIVDDFTITTLRGRLLGVNPMTHQPRAGIIWYTTTPKGKTGWLYERWKKGDPRFSQSPGYDPEKYLSLRVKTTDNPLLAAEDVQLIMQDYSDRMIRQELEGEFLDSETSEFQLDQVLTCCDEVHDAVVQQLMREINEWRGRTGRKRSLKADLGFAEELVRFELEPQAGHQYLASWDLGKRATKAGRNATVGMVFDITEHPWRMVAYRYEEGTMYLPAVQWIEDLHTCYSSRGTRCITVIDASGKGDVLNEIITAEHRFSVEGIVYSAMVKPNLLAAGKLAIERGLVRFPFIRRFVDQLSIYEQDDKELPQDTVMTFCQAMFKARELLGIRTMTRNQLVTPVVLRPSITPLPGAEAPNLERMYARRRLALHQRSGRTTR